MPDPHIPSDDDSETTTTWGGSSTDNPSARHTDLTSLNLHHDSATAESSVAGLRQPPKPEDLQIEEEVVDNTTDTAGGGGHYALSLRSVDVADGDGFSSVPLSPASNHDLVGIGAGNLPPVEYEVDLRPFSQELQWRSWLLKARCTITFIAFDLMVACMLAGLVLGFGTDRTVHYSSMSIHIMSRTVPALISLLTGLTFLAIINDFSRMLPFFLMADQGETIGSASPADSVAGIFFPRTSVRNGRQCLPEPAMFMIGASKFAAYVIPAIKMVLFSSTQSGSEWVLTIRPLPALALIIIYLFMFAVIFGITSWTRGRATGLRWDPDSILNQVALFVNTNALNSLRRVFDGTTAAFLNSRLSFRIGHWFKVIRSSPNANPERISVYGVGVVSAPPAEQHPHATDIHHDNTDGSTGATNNTQPDDSHRCNIDQPYQVPTGISIAMLVWWKIVILASLGISIWALISGAVRHGFNMPYTWRSPPSFLASMWYGATRSAALLAGVSDHVVPQEPVSTRAQATQGNPLYYSMVFVAIPVQLAWMFSLTAMRHIDIHMRTMRPLTNMLAKPMEDDGSSTSSPEEDSISLTYLNADPVTTIMRALGKGHWKVAYFAFLSLASSMLPVFVASILEIRASEKQVFFEFSKFNFWATFTFLVLYLFSLPLAWPGPSRRLPRQILSLADLLSLCCCSKFLEMDAFKLICDETINKRRFEAEFVVQNLSLALGSYVGTCGRRHFGFDIVDSVEPGAANTVTFVPPEKFSIKKLFQQWSSSTAAWVGALNRKVRLPARGNRFLSPRIRQFLRLRPHRLPDIEYQQVEQGGPNVIATGIESFQLPSR